MIEPKAKCPICGKEYFSRDLRNPAKTCGDKICITNYKYQEKHYDPRTGEKPSPEDMKTWK
jgi:hypothetical protein